ncbi:UNVERIFIED_CONTAM: hypothetical protein Scaly_2790300 [Sesamum calycinum]|uniref:Retrotransposon gag domain-containing protein n=1 Tax=Sesamum calycinum TaxID=2727403 RepID=A0AAW2IYM5_9LAMI
MAWSRAMRIALGEKMKLEFMTGKCVRPDENYDDFEKWMRVDCMVTSWLLNSISKDIVDAFLYSASAHDLWAELEQRFGKCNDPLLYQIQREITYMSQGALSVTGYFTKLKQLWHELTYLAPVPHCNCEYSRTVVDFATSNQLMQFPMGLNDIYDHVRNQILVTDPLPNVNKEYSMILRVEKQWQINFSLNEGNEGVAMFTRAGAYKKDGQNKSNFKKRNFVDKKNLRCDNCNRSGHDKSTCFKIHAIPDWYKDLTEQRKKDGTGDGVFNVQTSDNRVGIEVHSTSDAASVSEMCDGANEIHERFSSSRTTTRNSK